MRRRLAALAAAASLLLTAGCGDQAPITDGGRVVGDTLVVFSALPGSEAWEGAARDLVLGEKLALAEAGGQAGGYPVAFAAVQLPDDRGRKAIAGAVREVIRDVGVSAVIGDLTYETAEVSVPLYNGAGILHVSPSAAYTGFLAPVGGLDPGAPERYTPSGRPTFAPLLPTDAAQAEAIARAAAGDVAVEATAGRPEEVLAAAVRRRVGRTVPVARADTVVVAASDPADALGVTEDVLAENARAQVVLPAPMWMSDLPRRFAGEERVRFLTAARLPDTAFADAFAEAFGRPATPAAQIGYDAMRAVLAAMRRAGERAAVRERLIEAYFAADPLAAAADRPFRLASVGQDGGVIYEPLSALSSELRPRR